MKRLAVAMTMKNEVNGGAKTGQNGACCLRPKNREARAQFVKSGMLKIAPSKPDASEPKEDECKAGTPRVQSARNSRVRRELDGKKPAPDPLDDALYLANLGVEIGAAGC